MKCPECEYLIPNQQIKFEHTEAKEYHSFNCPNCGASIKCKPFNWLKALLIFIVLVYIIPYVFQFFLFVLLLLNYKD
jgi:hypothetical protein